MRTRPRPAVFHQLKGLAVLFLLVVIGCTRDEASRVADEPSTTARSPGAAGYHDEEVEWFLRSISRDGKTIEIVYTMSGVASGCEKKGRATATEKEDRVYIYATKLVTDDRNVACTEELAYVDEAVVLKQPLGDRRLLGCLTAEQMDEAAEDDPPEDEICRDLKRSQDAGVFEGSASPPPAVPGY